jgi:hypothetical protein
MSAQQLCFAMNLEEESSAKYRLSCRNYGLA